MKKILLILIAYIITLNSCNAGEEVVLEIPNQTPYVAEVEEDTYKTEEKTLKEKFSGLFIRV